MSNSSLQNDIDYMKSLAEAGGAGPLKNGGTLFWAGLLYAAAAIGQYAVTMGWLPQTQTMSLIVWFGASAIFAVIAVVLRLNQRGKGSATDRASASAWSGVGIGIMAFLLTIGVIANRVENPGALTYMLAPGIMVLYGIGWWVSAKMSGLTWLKWVAFGCFVAAPVQGFVSGSREQLLVYAACLIVLATVPGYVLMRAEKA